MRRGDFEVISFNKTLEAIKIKPICKLPDRKSSVGGAFYPIIMNKFDSDIFNADEFSIQLVSPDLRQQLIGIYHEEVENYLKQARAALAERDAAKLHQAAHSLKGVVGNYLGTRAFAAATALDSAARKEDLDAAAVRLAKCEKEVELLGEALLAYREENA